MQDPDDISAFADRILTALSAPLTLADRQVVPSASIGLVTLEAVGEAQPEWVMRDADLAMYRAKRGGKNRHASFDLDLRTSLLNRLDTETGLRLALPSGELHLAYQPVVDLRDHRRTTGAEALLRWTHPTRGELLPGDFLSVAEETGLIEQIGAWVLMQATSDAVSWYLASDAPHGSPVFRPTIAVNVSVRQIGGVALRRAVETIIEEALIEPSRIQLEVTESQFMAASASTVRELTALHDLGLSLSLDDFGTGYSSLSYLKHFPFDTVKVDRSFTAGVATDPGDRAIVTAILGLAGALQLRTVAEGVETAEQADILTDLGCQLGQGWYFGRPMPFGALIGGTATRPGPSSTDG
jgi:EAL domain-containing protein (putative c-di-GMP-specific phosphodiesterase class I)